MPYNVNKLYFIAVDLHETGVYNTMSDRSSSASQRKDIDVYL